MKCVVLTSGVFNELNKRTNQYEPVDYSHLIFRRPCKDNPQVMELAVQTVKRVRFQPGTIIDVQCDLHGQIISVTQLGMSETYAMMQAEIEQ